MKGNSPTKSTTIGNWQEKCKPCMCVYKVVTCNVRTHFPGAEKLVGLEHRKINFKFHQQIFTSIDSWFGLTWDEVREQEVQLRTELDTQRAAYGLCFFSLR
uniref:Phosphatidylinositol transfer protein N-terminal domain-containing protein n=1 Tax=Meloidogyne enterolobii TaxID=390850 RepID=A0A6V7VUP3_MELEN|nr:unnamed protein product [Meloidogyne enterolobii]